MKPRRIRRYKKVLLMEIHTNEDTIKTVTRSGVPDAPLPPEIVLQITVDKSKSRSTQTGSKSPRTQAQAATESDKNGKKSGEGGTQSRRQGASNPGKPEELSEEVEAEDNRAKSEELQRR